MEQILTPSVPIDQSPLPQTGPPDALGRQAASGLVWMTSQTVLTKVLAIVSQIVLAWRLDQKDFALVALAFAVAAFASLFQQIGVREVLIQRHLDFPKLASAATWLTLLLGIHTGLVMALAGPIAARLYNEPALIGLILVLALTAPFTSLLQIPLAALQIQMRHKIVAVSGLIVAVLNPLLSIALAYAGYGAYSFVLPILITTMLRVIMLWMPAAVPFRMRPEINLWPQIFRAGMLVLVTWGFALVIWQGDYLILGWFDKAALAFYYFAFNLSLQTLVLLGPNLDGVLLPTLSRLQGQPDRQREAFLLMTRAIAFFSFPICFLQAALAGPIIRVFFAPKWVPAIPVMAILSIGMAFRTSGWASHSLFLAQGRYKVFALFHVIASFVFVALVLVAVMLGRSWHTAAMTVAIAVSFYYMAEAPAKMLLAIRPMRGTGKDVAMLFIPPMALSAVAIALGTLIAKALPAMRFRDWLQIAMVSAVSAGIFVLAARQLMPQTWRSIWDRAVALMRGRQKETV